MSASGNQNSVRAGDVRCRLAAAVLVAGGILAASGLALQVLILVLLALAARHLRLPLRGVGRGVLGIAGVLGFVLAANALWYLIASRVDWIPPGVLLRPAGWALLGARLGNLLLLGLVMSSSTTPADAAAAVESMLRPLVRLHAPLGEIGFAAALSIGFLPLLREEADRMALALQLREGRRRPPAWARARLAVPLAVPLFVGVLRRADEVSLALDARAFDPNAGRTSFAGGGAGRWDLLLLVASGGLLGLGILL